MLNGKHDDPTFSYDGTKAVWDPTVITSEGVARTYAGSWEDIEDEMRSSSVVANDFVQMLTRTDSDRFYITADDTLGCFCLYYHPAVKPDSDKMSSIKQALNLPSHIQYDRSLCFEGAGWAGPLRWEVYGAQGIAEDIEYVLTDMHQAIQYYITEPEPGVFYLLYGE